MITICLCNLLMSCLLLGFFVQFFFALLARDGRLILSAINTVPPDTEQKTVKGSDYMNMFNNKLCFACRCKMFCYGVPY